MPVSRLKHGFQGSILGLRSWNSGFSFAGAGSWAVMHLGEAFWPSQGLEILAAEGLMSHLLHFALVLQLSFGEHRCSEMLVVIIVFSPATALIMATTTTTTTTTTTFTDGS